jgi:hypothetical protein
VRLPAAPSQPYNERRSHLIGVANVTELQLQLFQLLQHFALAAGRIALAPSPSERLGEDWGEGFSPICIFSISVLATMLLTGNCHKQAHPTMAALPPSPPFAPIRMILRFSFLSFLSFRIDHRIFLSTINYQPLTSSSG